MKDQYDVVIVGAGFTGLSAGLALTRAGLKVRVVEKDQSPGGLGGAFQFPDGSTIEKFYHHLFLSDVFVSGLAESLGLKDRLVDLPSKTGMYYNKSVWRLTTPLDLLRFKPLPFFDRVRLGLVVLGVRFLKDWKTIEDKTVREWLEPLCGKRAYNIVWAPLIDSKFSSFADVVNAVWFWKKLVLRGGTRGKGGEERLMYFKGGFGTLAEAVASELVRLGGRIDYGVDVTGVQQSGEKVLALDSSLGPLVGEEFLFTPAFPIVAGIFSKAGHQDWVARLKRVNYLGNICLVLSLDRPLSDTYWINVNDPGFPFVGVIEHTNLDTRDDYHGRHIVFLSRYIDTTNPEWTYSDDLYFDYAMPFLKRMFPAFEKDWVVGHATWRAEYAQPIAEKNYSQYVPGRTTPFTNVTLANMAQIYPEDRGLNYSIRDGEAVARLLLEKRV